jgi:phospholipid/cholesterol/gamma-HCH transport system ATP-binding protein
VRNVAPVLELLQAETVPTSGLGVSAPISLRLMPGDCAVIEGADAAQLDAFADLCSGVVPLRRGQARFLGRDWATLPHEYAAALRGRIGRAFGAGGWLPFLDAETNILLAQLHHTRRERDDLRAEATVLAQGFGLPGIPQGRLTGLSPGDLVRAMLVRAFLGEPLLVLLEEPAGNVYARLGTAVLNRMAAVRDRGGAVVWLSRTRLTRASHAFPASQWLRITGQGLIEIRAAA